MGQNNDQIKHKQISDRGKTISSN